MTQDEVIDMARQAGFLYGKMGPLDMPFVTAIGHTFTVELEAFAKLVAEKATEEANARANASWTLMCKKMVAFERDACAKVCDELQDVPATEPHHCAEDIRARGEA
jgi:hypothetical protein